MKISLHSKCFLPSKVFACPWRQEKDSWHKNWYLPHHSLSCKKRNSLNYCFKRYIYQINLTEEDFSAHSWKQQSVPAMAFAYSRHICAYMIFSLVLGGWGGKRCTIEDENNNEGSFWLERKTEERKKSFQSVIGFLHLVFLWSLIPTIHIYALTNPTKLVVALPCNLFDRR